LVHHRDNRHSSATPACEWRTLLLIIAVYGLFAIVTWHFAVLPVWASVPAGACLVALHSSLQHEAIHGHPTRMPVVNALLVALPLALVMPYGRYRATHLRHHCDARLTDPYDDPESYYLSGRDWSGTHAAMRTLLRANNTLLGRLTIGPVLWSVLFFAREARLLRHSPRMILRAWLPHLAGATALAVWVVGMCGIGIAEYLLFFVYPGTALIMLRSYAEHQAHAQNGLRTAIVETNPLMALIFLNNNLHFAHHKHPRAPWYRLPEIYRLEQPDILAANGGYRFAGYLDLARRHLVRAKEPVAHPYV
jgi:fatty acid desaturase